MSFVRVTDDQAALCEAAASFVAGRMPVESVRKTFDDARGVDDAYLAATADLGWYAAFVPEELGGGSVSGSPVIDAALVSEQRGRGLQPGPYVSTNVVAAAVATHGTEAQRKALLEDLATGRATAAWAVADGTGRWPAAQPPALLGDAGGLRLEGRSSYVQDAATAERLLVVATRDGALCQVLVRTSAPGVRVRPLTTFDLTSRLADVTFEDVSVDADDLVGGGDQAVDEALQLAALLTAADAVGAMDRLVELATQYAKDRHAFGRPIGSFQAIKHLLADLSLVVQQCKAVTASAAEALAAGSDYAGEVVSMAKAFTSDAAFQVAQGAHQVHGGIGFAWEHDLHLFQRRLAGDSALYGDGDAHRLRICARHGL